VKQYLLRLDHIAGRLNGWLFAIALGLAVLDFTVLIVKAIEALPLPPQEVSAPAPNHAASLSTPSGAPSQQS
jgi:hypothetical protein